MNGTCACGAVKFVTPTEKPLHIWHCHCIDCQRQSASAFGTSAIFPFFRVDGNPNVAFFVRQCESGRKQSCYFCKKCGSRILHTHIVDSGDPPTVAVKGGLLEGLDWKSAKHIFIRSAVFPIPEGVQSWEAEPDMKELKRA